MDNTDFVRRFEEAWREPLTKFPALFHPRGTLYQSGMPAPVAAEAIAAHQQRTLQLVPDIAIRADNWAVNGANVLIEWTATGTVFGSPTEWSGASRFTLEDGLIVEEIAYFDPSPLRQAAVGLAAKAG